MLKGHPKGLFVAFFTNMGERFGFYTMMAILVLFLQARYGLTSKVAGEYYSWFYFAIYALALIGGLVADYTKKYKLIIFTGQVIMFAGYCIIAIPGMSLLASLGGLFVIALGNGLFKGNLQAVVGQLYDDEKYSKVRDNAFMIFYMGINIGAFFAPFVAASVRNWWLGTKGFLNDGDLPALCHGLINGTLTDTSQMQALATKVSSAPVTDLKLFATQYLDAFSQGYNYAFAVAAGAMIISLVVYMVFNKHLPTVNKVKDEPKTAQKPVTNFLAILISLALMVGVALIFHFTMNDIGLGAAIGLFVAFISFIFQISTKEERPRVTALILVFIVVIFFWMSFHQNGLTLTMFARDYTAKTVDRFTYLFFGLKSILCVIGAIGGIILALRKRDTSADATLSSEELNKAQKSETTSKTIGAAMAVIFGGACAWFVINADVSNPISPEIFQAFNPLFIVALTPIVMGAFVYMNKRGKEPSTPKKIGIGMIIASIGFVVVLIGSIGLASPKVLGMVGAPDAMRVSPYWLMSSYLILTVAELFLSPMGLSFVSKVAPQRFQGLMQGGWLLATAVGNKLLFIGSTLWGRIDLYMLWGLFIICCLISATFIFSIMKRLEKVTN